MNPKGVCKFVKYLDLATLSYYMIPSESNACKEKNGILTNLMGDNIAEL